jgi:hypothetical protein
MSHKPSLFIIAGAICVPLLMIACSLILPWIGSIAIAAFGSIDAWMSQASSLEASLFAGPFLGAAIGGLLYLLTRELKNG